MVLFDTNIFIYITERLISPSRLWDTEVAYASVTIVEALGYPDITVAEQRKLDELFGSYLALDLKRSIIEGAVALRQAKKMSLGDAIVAATALEYDYELWTANTRDFVHIDGLKLVNPLLADE